MTENICKEANPIRTRAFDNLIKGLPNKKDENWRFTDISSIKKGSFRISEKKDAPNADYNISGTIRISENGGFFNGHFKKVYQRCQKDYESYPIRNTWNIMAGLYHNQPNPHLIF